MLKLLVELKPGEIAIVYINEQKVIIQPVDINKKVTEWVILRNLGVSTLKPKRKRLTNAQKETIKKLLRAGYSIKETYTQTGFDELTISYYQKQIATEERLTPKS
jgi:hypothetical protein